jgi:predicted nuclease of predicted toxin-antitoxin system
MAVAFYFDHNIPRAIASGLRTRGVNLVTAMEDGMDRAADPAVLDRATELGRALFSMDQDMLVEAARRQGVGLPFAGVIFAGMTDVSIGTCVHDLEIIAKAGEPDDLRSCVLFLPL